MEDRQHNVGSDGSGHEAAHKALGDYEGPLGGILSRPSNQETRIAAAMAPRRRAAGRRISSKAETQKKRSGEERGPLQGRPSPAESERRHLAPKERVGGEDCASAFYEKYSQNVNYESSS